MISMTTRAQKQIEIHWATCASNLLGEPWSVRPSPDEREWPDLCVDSAEERFGLEVRECFRDERKKGSALRAGEAQHARRLQDIARRYYERVAVPVQVEIAGPIASGDHVLDLLLTHAPRLNQWEESEVREGASVLYIMRLPGAFGSWHIQNT